MPEVLRSHARHGARLGRGPQGGWELRFTHCCKMRANPFAHEGLNLGGRHAGDVACLGLAILQNRMRHIIPVAAVVEEAAGQNGRRASEPNMPGDGVGHALGLHSLK